MPSISSLPFNYQSISTGTRATGNGTSGSPIDVPDGVIDNDALADMATKTYKGRTSAGTGVPEDVGIATVKADLSVDDLVTLSGVADGATNLGTFTGTTIADSQTIKAALQALETALEAVSAGASYAWYDMGSDNIWIKATTDPTAWFTRNAAGSYSIVVADGQELSAIRFISKASAIGADQNIPGGAITIELDYSTFNSGAGIGWSDRSDLGNTPTLRGMDTSGNCVAAGSVTASSVTLTVASVAVDVVTINGGSISSVFADGSDIFLENLDLQ